MTHPLARQLVVALIVGLHLLGDVAAIPILYHLQLGDESGNLLLGVLFGVLLGQTSLLAAYVAWGSERWFLRCSASCVLAVLVWYATAAGAMSTGNSFEVSSAEQLLAVVIALSFGFAAVACRAIGARWRSRISVLPNDRVAKRELQSLLPLSAVAVGTAVVLGAMFASHLGREIWARNWTLSFDGWLFFAFWMAIWAGLSLLVAIPAAWACLGKDPPAARLPRVGRFVAALAALEWAVVYGASGKAYFGLLALGLNLGVLYEVVACSMMLRACGCRLHLRARRPAICRHTMRMDSITNPLARQLIVALVVCLHLLGDVAAIPTLVRLKLGESGMSLAVPFGVLLGQTSLLAAYLAWGPERWFVRCSTSCLLALLVWYATAAGAMSTRNAFGVDSTGHLLATVVATSFVFASVACWVLGARWGSRISVIPDDRGSELGLRSLLPLRAVAAGAVVMLGAMFASRLGREIWARPWAVSWDYWLVFALWMAICTGLSLLVAIPAAWVCLGKEPPGARLLVVGSFVATLVALEWAALYEASGEPSLGVLAVGLNLGVLCEVVACSLLFRACGCRLHLRGPRSASLSAGTR